MVCRVGDTVRFLNDVGGGVLIRFIGKNQALVRDSDGFEIPVLISELVVVSDSSFEKEPAPKELIKPIDSKQKKLDGLIGVSVEKKEKESTSRITDDFEILVGFCPKKQDVPMSGEIDMYLINDSTYQLFYSFGFLDGKGYISPIQSGILEDDSKHFIKSLSSNEVNSIQQLCVSLALFKSTRYKLLEPEQVQLSLNPVKLFRVNAFVENDFFEEKALLYTLLGSTKTLKEVMQPTVDEISDAMKEKKTKSIQSYKVSEASEIVEVDLHIESLVDDLSKLSSSEIIDIQLSRFIRMLDMGMRAGTKRMVFIHGVGNGKLKYEILRLLNTQYAGKLRYQDASFKEYGYGATMVLL